MWSDGSYRDNLGLAHTVLVGASYSLQASCIPVSERLSEFTDRLGETKSTTHLDQMFWFNLVLRFTIDTEYRLDVQFPDTGTARYS